MSNAGNVIGGHKANLNNPSMLVHDIQFLRLLLTLQILPMRPSSTPKRSWTNNLTEATSRRIVVTRTLRMLQVD